MSTDRQAEAVRGVLASKGYGFHYRAVKEIVQLNDDRLSLWRLDTTEFPVEVNGTHLHIDIILRSASGLMLIECKRANPSVSTWCFARSEYGAPRMQEAKAVRLESVNTVENGSPIVRRSEGELSDHQYHIGFEIKGSDKGEASSPGRGALDEAVTQALRSASGIINEIERRRFPLGRYGSLAVIPVVLTTAKLVTCATDLAAASFEDGTMPLEVEVSERPWLWYRVNPSAHLRHGVVTVFGDTDGSRPKHISFRQVADVEYARSVAIVSWNGLREFLGVASNHIGDDE